MRLSVTSLAIVTLALLFSASDAIAQSAIPQRVSYQGVARGDDGLALPNTTVDIRFTILENSVLGSIVYVEEHQVTTNEFGLFTLFLGGGNPQLGRFDELDWHRALKFMRVEIDLSREGDFETIGTQPLVSVPYALAAGKPADLRLGDLVDVDVESALNGESLRFDGTSWVAGEAGTGSFSTDATLAGLGSSSDPLGLARQDALFGQVLKWDGGGWTPADDVGENFTAGAGIVIVNGEIRHDAHSGDVRGDVELTVTGLRGLPIIALRPTTGQVLKYVEGQGWGPSTDNSQILRQGNGIAITNGVVSNAAWQVNGSNVFLKTGGNAGIGTGNPTERLDVAGAVKFSGELMPAGKAGLDGQILVSDGANKPPVWSYPSDALGGTAWSTTGNANTSVGTNFIGTTDSNPLLVKTANAERIRITAAGNVGINETTPGSALEVGGGDVYVNGSANGVILRSPDNSCWRIQVDNTGAVTTTAVSCP